MINRLSLLFTVHHNFRKYFAKCLECVYNLLYICVNNKTKTNIMKKPLQEGINMKNLTANEWNQFKIYFDFMIKSGYSELESKEQAYNKAIKNRVVGMFTSKNYRH